MDKHKLIYRLINHANKWSKKKIDKAFVQLKINKKEQQQDLQ